MDNKKLPEQRHYNKIQNRLAIVFAALAAVITLVFALLVYSQARNYLFQQFRDRVLSLASVAASQQLADSLPDIRVPSDQTSPIYQSIQEQNSKIANSDPTIGSVYLMRQYETGEIYFVVEGISDAEREIRSPKKYGSLYRDPGPVLKESFASMGGPVVESDFHTNTREWERAGTWLSAYAPITASDGTRVGVLGVDMSAEAILASERNLLVSTIILLVISLPIFAGVGWFIGSRLAQPIVQLTKGVNKITAGELHYVVNVKSGDEVEALADSFNTMTARLNELVANLELRVEERTRNLTAKTNELEEASRKMENRASQLTAVSIVARSVTTMRDVNQLLPSVTEIISKQFGFYHTGIFLNDQASQFAILRAANSVGGKKMLAQGHRLRIGQVGIVGNVASTGKPRIALDTGEDAVFFNNPNLPETKSEMALPLKVGEKIIGVLDVQSMESAAFNPEDVEILSILADQVSIAIDNANLFEEAQKSTADAQSALRQYTRSDWNQLVKYRKHPGFRYTFKGVEPLEIQKPIEGDSTGDGRSVIRIPIKVHDEQIGSLRVVIPSSKTLSKDEMDIAQSIAERVALSVENVRLLEETSSRAEREKTVAEISNKIRSTNDPELMIQTALQELQKALGASKVQILPHSSPSNNLPEEPAASKPKKSRSKTQEE